MNIPWSFLDKLIEIFTEKVLKNHFRLPKINENIDHFIACFFDYLSSHALLEKYALEKSQFKIVCPTKFNQKHVLKRIIL